ncbi:MAG: tetratricopeptide repeat protein [Pseudanabaenaceae cyanobacterium bins.68]|nr:tetratricopeptide repeat protein [Pseudanabaenaceae cyanobacterium bins.68]
MQLPSVLIQGRKTKLNSRQSGIAYFEKCLAQATAAHSPKDQIPALIELALELAQTKQAEAIAKAQDLLNQAQQIPTTSRSEYFTALLSYGQGVLALEQNQPSQGFNLLQQALKLFTSLQEGCASDEASYLQDNLSLVDDALGVYYMAANQFPPALSHLERSLTRRQSLPELSYGIATSYFLMGQLYMRLFNFDQAEAAFGKSLDAAIDGDYNHLRLKSLVGMVQVAIARTDWDMAEAMIEEATPLLEMPTDLDQVVILAQSKAEALLGNRQVLEAQDCIELEALPQFDILQHPVGLAITQRTLGRILRGRLLEGLDRLTTETIETVEDYFSEAAMVFQEWGMLTEYVLTLHDTASLYTVCEEFKFNRYQYQGKAVRALKLALAALEKMEGDTAALARLIEDSLDRVIGNLS